MYIRTYSRASLYLLLKRTLNIFCSKSYIFSKQKKTFCINNSINSFTFKTLRSNYKKKQFNEIIRKKLLDIPANILIKNSDRSKIRHRRKLCVRLTFLIQRGAIIITLIYFQAPEYSKPQLECINRWQVFESPARAEHNISTDIIINITFSKGIEPCMVAENGGAQAGNRTRTPRTGWPSFSVASAIGTHPENPFHVFSYIIYAIASLKAYLLYRRIYRYIYIL